MQPGDKKNVGIESLRGIAVLVVVLYHYTSRLPPAAFGSAQAPLIVTHSGKIGVYIFFIISGFLIAQSIEKSRSLADFYAKRVVRIWPLFAFASILVFIVTKTVSPPVVHTGVDPFYTQPRTLLDLAGSIFFLKDLGFQWIDGAFWSILVELKFYFIVGVFAVIFRGAFIERFAVFAIAFSSIDFLIIALNPAEGGAFSESGFLRPLSQVLHGALISIYLPLFALGLMLHRGRLDGIVFALVILSLISMIVAIAEDGKFNAKEDVLFMILLSMALAIDRYLLGGSVFLWIGTYSYAIYLFHQMIGLTFMKHVTPLVGIDAAVIAALLMVCAIAWTSSKLVEWRFRKPLMALATTVLTRLGLDRLKVGHRAEALPNPVADGQTRAIKVR